MILVLAIPKYPSDHNLKLRIMVSASTTDDSKNNHDVTMPLSIRNPNRGGPNAVLTTSKERNRLRTVPRKRMP
jgi:hypothetical protein